MTRQAITEKEGIHKQWYKDAKSITSWDDFDRFRKKLLDTYEHDYGTVCHAIAAIAVAAAWCSNRDEGSRGGITGFQSGAVMWEFVQHWLSEEGKPMRLVKFEDMLYPQYLAKFCEKTISADTWKFLQEEAKKRLETTVGYAHPEVVAHWKSIVGGTVPFGYTVVPD